MALTQEELTAKLDGQLAAAGVDETAAGTAAECLSGANDLFEQADPDAFTAAVLSVLLGALKGTATDPFSAGIKAALGCSALASDLVVSLKKEDLQTSLGPDGVVEVPITVADTTTP